MTLDKLKVAARQHEQREDWRAAIELYRQAIRAAEGGSEGGDPALHNRIGDLEHKAGNELAACEAWAVAAARYGDQGFFNNAVALCGKILRLNPGRVQTHLDLARFHARKRVLYEVRQDLMSYRDQMSAAGDGEEALAALTRFGNEFSAWRDLQGLLDELLGRETASSASEGGASAEGDRSQGLVFLDTDGAGPLRLEPTAEVAFVEPTALDVDEGLEFETTAIVELETPSVEMAAPAVGLEPTAITVEPLDLGDVEVTPDVVDFERTADAAGDTPAVAGLDAIEFVPPEHAASGAIEGLEATQFEAPTPDEQPVTEPDLSDVIRVDLPHAPTRPPAPSPPAGGTDGIVFLDTDSAGTRDATGGAAPSADTAADGEGEGESDEADPLGDRVTAHALLEHGDRAGGIAALERALDGHIEQSDWVAAFRVASDLVAAEPQSINRHQARVEVAAKWGDAPHLCEAYQALGEAFLRLGATDKAVAVFRRVLEIDELHAGAREALRRMAPEAAETDPDGFIDFGAMVNDDTGPRSTRMRTETTAVSPDEDETFREALAEFKRALDQNLSIEDHQTHYDLGLAFREMGLFEEAIGEFQKALRSPEGRLRTAEALGQTFYDQGRPAVAEAVLRSVERGAEDDADKIGVLYWLGRALEAQQKGDAARGCYERVLAVDVSFLDTVDRLTALASGGGSE